MQALNLGTGLTVLVRPVTPADEGAIHVFLGTLSIDSRRLRFFSGAPDLSAEAHRGAAADDVDHHGVLAIAPHRGIVGHAIYVRLAQFAEHRHITSFSVQVLPENRDMLAVFRGGFAAVTRARGEVMELDLLTSSWREAQERSRAINREHLGSSPPHEGGGLTPLSDRPPGASVKPMLSSSPTSQPPPFRVVIAGAGVAGLEAMMALREHAGDRVSIALLSPADELFYRPLSVRAPFASGSARTYSISRIAADFDTTVIRDGFGWVDPDLREVETQSGERLPYDALLLTLGARPVPAFDRVHTIDARRMDESFGGLVQDMETGYVRRVTFVAPPGPFWPLPLYELALMTARRAFEMCVKVDLAIVTPEDAPLAIFGKGASAVVSELLDQAGIVTYTSSYPSVTDSGLKLHPGGRSLQAGRIVALPKLVGPAVRGLPSVDDGFIPVTPYAEVCGVPRVFAAGDATDFAVKHGGVAAQQACVAANSIAALAGLDVAPEPFRPIIRGILLTGAEPRYMTARITGGAGFSSTMSLQCPWSPRSKIAAEHLAPYLAGYDDSLLITHR